MTTWELLSQFGLPVGMLLAALVLGSRRTWVWGSELSACEERMDELRADYERRLAEQRSSHLRREQELADATEKWQALFMATLPALRGLTEAVETTAHTKDPR